MNADEFLDPDHNHDIDNHDIDDDTPISADAAHWAGELLDDRAAESPPEEPDARRDAADLLFLDALLKHYHDPRPQEREARIERVMAAIQADANQSTGIASGTRQQKLGLSEKSSRGQGWARRIAALLATAAAAAGVALFFSWTAPGAKSAYAAVDNIYRATAAPTDRQYVVIGNFQNLTTGAGRQIQSDLYVRGAERFAIRHPSLLGPVWIGSDGRRGWMLTPFNFVMHRDDPRLTIMWAREEGVTMPELQLTSQLDAARAYFDLDLLPSEQIDPLESPIAETSGPTLANPNISWQRIRCGIKRARPDQPYVLELWAHPDSGVLRRMVFHWRPYSSWRGLNKVTVDLVAEQPQADSWYEPKGHIQKAKKSG